MFGWFKKDCKPDLKPVDLPPSKGYTLANDIAIGIALESIQSQEEANRWGSGLQIYEIRGPDSITWEARHFGNWLAEIVYEDGKYYRVTRTPVEG